jgi:lipopolysaccharide export system permease protein
VVAAVAGGARVKTLDAHVARQYLLNIVLLTVILFSFVVAVDASLNLPRFVLNAERNAERAGQSIEGFRKTLAALLLVVDLWWPRLLQLFTYTSGLILVGAMGFTLAQMVRHRELVAMMASGVSLYRVARPIFAVALLVLGVQAAMQEFLIPRIAPLLLRENDQAGRRDLSAFPVNLVPDSAGRLWSAERFDPGAGTLTGVHVWERDAAGKAVGLIRAEAARWSPGVWTLEGGRRRELTPPAPEAARPEAAPVRPVVVIATDLDPTTLLTNEHRMYAANLSWTALARIAASPNVKPEVRQQLQRLAWGRVSVAVCTLLTMAMCLPFFLLREPRDLVLQSVKCAPVAVGALLGSAVAVAAPVPGLPPVVAVFVPVLALLPLALAMGTSVRT